MRSQKAVAAYFKSKQLLPFGIALTNWMEHRPFCAHIGWIVPGEPAENDEMNQMTLRTEIQDSNPGDLRLSTLPLGHGGSQNTESLRVSGKETFVSLKPGYQNEVLADNFITTTRGPHYDN